MRHIPALAAAALACALALNACATPPVAPPTPTPLPTFRCTPEAGGAEYDCDQRSHEEMLAKDALYAEAEEVYRQLSAERVRLYSTGATADNATLNFVTGKAEDLIRAAHSRGDRMIDGTIQIAWISRLPGLSMSGSVVAIEACLDAHTARVSSTGRSFNTTGYTRERAYLIGTSDSLRIANFQNKDVASCER